MLSNFTCNWCGVLLIRKARFCGNTCRNRQYRLDHPERFRAASARWYSKNIARNRESCREYYQRHLEERRAYRASKAEERYEDTKKRRQQDPDRYNEYGHRRRARRVASGVFQILPSDWRRLVERYRYSCAYCGSRSEELHQEHVIPLSRGGRHSIGNLLPSCPSCNYSKGTKLLSEWEHAKRRAGSSRSPRAARPDTRVACDQLADGLLTPA